MALLSGREIALFVEAKLKPAKTAWQNADCAEKADLRESASGFLSAASAKSVFHRWASPTHNLS